MDFVTGIDVYSLNSPDDSTNATDQNMKAANWKAVYDYGVRFAYIKASEYRADAGFTERMQLAKNAGVLRGAYILPHFELNNIADQVNLFIQTVGSDKGELPPALGLESPGGNWPVGRPLFNKIKDCLDRMSQAFGRKPIIYTSQSIVLPILTSILPPKLSIPIQITRRNRVPNIRHNPMVISHGSSGNIRTMAVCLAWGTRTSIWICSKEPTPTS